MVFFRLSQEKNVLGHYRYGGASIQYPQVFTSPYSDTYPKDQVLGPTRASPSELRGTGHLEPLVPQFAGHPHETASLLSVAVITTFLLTLGPLFSLGLRL